MLPKISNRPYSDLLWFIVPMLPCIITMTYYFPKGAFIGFDSFIMAFEFVQNPQMLEELFRSLSPEVFNQIDTGNYIDMIFMLAYSGFLGLFSYKLYQEKRNKWFLVGMLLALVALIFDLFENLHLLKLTSLSASGGSNESIATVIGRLQVLTWIKWLALALYFLMFGVVFINKENRLLKFVGALLCAPFILALFSLVSGQEAQWLNKFTLAIFAGFALLFLVAGLQKKELS